MKDVSRTRGLGSKLWRVGVTIRVSSTKQSHKVDGSNLSNSSLLKFAGEGAYWSVLPQKTNQCKMLKNSEINFSQSKPAQRVCVHCVLVFKELSSNLLWPVFCNLPFSPYEVIQWGYEQRTSWVFEWSKIVCKSNGLLFKPWLEQQTNSSLFRSQGV